MSGEHVWVRIRIEGGAMNIQASVPNGPAIAILEAAKLTLLRQMMGDLPSGGTNDPSAPAIASARAPALEARQVA